MLAEAFAIFVMLAILSALIIVHECGHFSVARLFGFQTPVFGFGLPFGPHWVVGKKWGTEFRIHACLLGGYVAIPELGDESNQDAFGMELEPFRKFPIWQRALVAFAGVGFNIIFAYLIMLVMIVNLGRPVQPTMVYELDKNVTVAAQAGVKAGDMLKSVDGVEIKNTQIVIDYFKHHKSVPVDLTVVRNEKPVTIKLTPNAEGRVGMMLVPGGTTYEKVSGNFIEQAGVAYTQLCDTTWQMVENLGQMLMGLFNPAKPSPGHPKFTIQDLHGVLAIIKIGADITKQDWTQLFLFTVLISMDLAIVNLVPWPALDGWHLATMSLEAVRGKPMDERAQGEFVKWGFISLIALMAVIMFNDVTALVSGKLDIRMGKDKGAKTQGVDKGAGSGSESSSSSDAASTESKPGDAGSSSSDAAPGAKSGSESQGQPQSQPSAGSTAESESGSSAETKSDSPAQPASTTGAGSGDNSDSKSQ